MWLTWLIIYLFWKFNSTLFSCENYFKPYCVTAVSKSAFIFLSKYNSF